MTKVQILVTGSRLISEGVRAIEPVLEEIITQAEKEIHIMAYMITPSALPILSLIEKVAARGVRVTILVNNFQSQNPVIVSKLSAIEGEFPHVKIFDFTDLENGQLHAKVIVADRRSAIIGSANLSWGGMFSNYEVGLLVEGDAAWKLAEIIDTLCARIKQGTDRRSCREGSEFGRRPAK